MSIEHCPECHQPLSETVHGVRLPAFKAGLFRYIESHPGMSGLELAVRFEKHKASIWSHIWQINDALMNTDIRIKGSVLGGYYIKNRLRQTSARQEGRRL